MSWEQELFSVYETQCGREFDGEDGLPKISHSTANAQIQITLNNNGDFVEARKLSKEEGQNTPIQVTEDSASRTSGDAAMPFADTLEYIAADYPKYVDGKDGDNSKKFSLYIEQLKDWSESEYTHPAVNALYNYIEKGTVIADLVRCGVLSVDETSGKLDNSKTDTKQQQKSFVRFRINGIDEPETWKNNALSEKFIDYYNQLLGEPVLCYALGKVLPPAEKHPSKIRNSGDKAKLISTNSKLNNKQNFVYRGRFSNDKEAFSVSYEFSQKMHAALKWLIRRQGICFDNSLTSIIWASTVEKLPDVYCKGLPEQDDDDDDPFADETETDVQKSYSELLKKRIFGNKSEITFNSKVMIMCMDSANPGRLSVSFYDELQSSAFYNNLVKWHEEIAAVRGYGKRAKINSFSVYEITNYAYGTETSKGFDCKAEVRKDLILRLLPCITQGRKLPADIVRAICRKASNPLAYEEKYNNHRKVLETACGLIRKFNIDRKEGVTTMAYDKNETDRSYLFGCLLAIADAAERNTYEKDEKNNRVTNARRYWSAFAQRPWTTWKIIAEKLLPYLDKKVDSGKHTGFYYNKKLDEIMGKFSIGEFGDDSALSPNYLLGYHHYSAEIYKSNNNDNKNEEE